MYYSDGRKQNSTGEKSKSFCSKNKQTFFAKQTNQGQVMFGQKSYDDTAHPRDRLCIELKASIDAYIRDTEFMSLRDNKLLVIDAFFLLSEWQKLPGYKFPISSDEMHKTTNNIITKCKESDGFIIKTKAIIEDCMKDTEFMRSRENQSEVIEISSLLIDLQKLVSDKFSIPYDENVDKTHRNLISECEKLNDIQSMTQ